MVGENHFFQYVRVFFFFSCIAFLCFFATKKTFATSGTFVISGANQSGDIFGFTGSSYSPTLSVDSATCVLFYSSIAVSTNDTCFPDAPDFVWSGVSGSYYVVTSYAGDTWTSNELAYDAPTPTPSTTPSTTITPVYIDIATGSALAIGIHDLGESGIFIGIVIIFWLVVWTMYEIMRKA